MKAALLVAASLFCAAALAQTVPPADPPSPVITTPNLPIPGPGCQPEG
jgi:hypothetical protein